MEDGHALVRLAAEQPLGVVEPRAREPHGARHRAVGEHPLVGPADLEALPDGGPEALEVGDGPLPQRRVVRRSPIGHEPAHVRALAQLGRRLPQQRALLHGGRS
jgi:hypothetical protein